LKYFTA